MRNIDSTRGFALRNEKMSFNNNIIQDNRFISNDIHCSFLEDPDSARIEMQPSQSSQNSHHSHATNQVIDDHPSALFLSKFDDYVRHMDIPQYLTDNKTILRFPEKLFLLIVEAEREASRSGRCLDDACLQWTSNGRAIIVRNNDECLNNLLPLASTAGQFSSFTRKLYRWGFRQVTSSPYDTCKKDEKVFWHPFFQRDNKPLTIKMKSITAEGKRKAQSAQAINELSRQPLNDPVPPPSQAIVPSGWHPLPAAQISQSPCSNDTLSQLSGLMQLPPQEGELVTPVSISNTDVLALLASGQSNVIQSPQQPLVGNLDLARLGVTLMQLAEQYNSSQQQQFLGTIQHQANRLPSTLTTDQLALLVRQQIIQQTISTQDTSQHAQWNNIATLQNIPAEQNLLSNNLNLLECSNLSHGANINNNPQTDQSLVAQTGLLLELRQNQRAILQALLGVASGNNNNNCSSTQTLNQRSETDF